MEDENLGLIFKRKQALQDSSSIPENDLKITFQEFLRVLKNSWKKTTLNQNVRMIENFNLKMKYKWKGIKTIITRL